MSSLHDHVANNGKTDAQKAAAKALLDAIANQVDETMKSGGGVDFVNGRLKALAEAYALVVHGRA
ncbi:hypothetical protein SGLAM104S_01606 [Streptomyces glaucescens]